MVERLSTCQSHLETRGGANTTGSDYGNSRIPAGMRECVERMEGRLAPLQGAFSFVTVSGGVRAASCFEMTPAGPEALDRRLFSRTASGVPKNPALHVKSGGWTDASQGRSTEKRQALPSPRGRGSALERAIQHGVNQL